MARAPKACWGSNQFRYKLVMNETGAIFNPFSVRDMDQHSYILALLGFLMPPSINVDTHIYDNGKISWCCLCGACLCHKKSSIAKLHANHVTVVQTIECVIPH